MRSSSENLLWTCSSFYLILLFLFLTFSFAFVSFSSLLFPSQCLDASPDGSWFENIVKDGEFQDVSCPGCILSVAESKINVLCSSFLSPFLLEFSERSGWDGCNPELKRIQGACHFSQKSAVWGILEDQCIMLIRLLAALGYLQRGETVDKVGNQHW